MLQPQQTGDLEGAGLERPQDPHIASRAGAPGTQPLSGTPLTVSLWLLWACEVGVGRGLCSPCSVSGARPSPALHPGPQSQIQIFLQAPSSEGSPTHQLLPSVSPLDHLPPSSSHPGPPSEALPPQSPLSEQFMPILFLDVLRAAERGHAVSVQRNPKH